MVISGILGIMVQKELVKMNVCRMLSVIPPVVFWVSNPLLKIIHSTFIPAWTTVSWSAVQEHITVQ